MTEPLQIENVPVGQVFSGTLGPQTLLGHLASTRGDVFSQAEVLCTLSLAWVLGRCERANLAFARMCGVDDVLTWQPEDHT
jgi:hypothetical protein